MQQQHIIDNTNDIYTFNSAYYYVLYGSHRNLSNINDIYYYIIQVNTFFVLPKCLQKHF